MNLNENRVLDIAYAAEGDKYKVARKWGHIQIVTRKWFQQSIARKGDVWRFCILCILVLFSILVLYKLTDSFNTDVTLLCAVCLNEESYPVLGSIPLNRGVRDLGRHNGQEKFAGCPVSLSLSAAAPADSYASYAQSRDSDIEASASQTVSFTSLKPSTDVKEPSEAPTTEPQEQNIDGSTARDSESEDNDLYLSDCRIFLVGFEASEMRRLVKLVCRGGGSRYMMLNERMTHIVVGTPSER